MAGAQTFDTTGIGTYCCGVKIDLDAIGIGCRCIEIGCDKIYISKEATDYDAIEKKFCCMEIWFSLLDVIAIGYRCM